MRILNLKDLSEFNEMLEMMRTAVSENMESHTALYSESHVYQLMTDAAFRGAKILKRIIDEND